MGTVAMSCGNGDFGRLGHGVAGSGDAALGLSADRFRPMLGLPPDASVRAVSAGGAHTAVVTSDGRVWTCGLDDHAQLGRATTASAPSTTLAPVEGLPEHDPVVAVAAGHHHTLCATASGEVWAFGRNDRGQCGLGPDAPAVVESPRVGRRALSASSSRRAARRRPPPRRGTRPLVRGDPPRRPVLVGRERRARARPRRRGTDAALGGAAGGFRGGGGFFGGTFSFFGGVFSRRRRRARRRVDAAARRALADANARVVDVRCGLAHAACLDDRGVVRVWGGGRLGQLSVDDARADSPTEAAPSSSAAAAEGRRAFASSRSGAFGVAARADGANGHGLVAWGANGNGELGLGEKRTHRARRGSGPRPVESFESGSSGSGAGPGFTGPGRGRAPRRRVAPRDGGDGGRAAVRVGVGRERRAARGRGVQLGGSSGSRRRGRLLAPARVPGGSGRRRARARAANRRTRRGRVVRVQPLRRHRGHGGGGGGS